MNVGICLLDQLIWPCTKKREKMNSRGLVSFGVLKVDERRRQAGHANTIQDHEHTCSTLGGEVAIYFLRSDSM